MLYRETQERHAKTYSEGTLFQHFKNDLLKDALIFLEVKEN